MSARRYKWTACLHVCMCVAVNRLRDYNKYYFDFVGSILAMAQNCVEIDFFRKKSVNKCLMNLKIIF